jgi:segregation and condensation protein A
LNQYHEIIKNDEKEPFYKVQVPFFEGPLELLYYLIQKRSLDITEISLSLVTNDFMGYVKHYESIHHKEIAEFIHFLSQLLYIKSQRLLPFEKDDDLSQEENDERRLFIERIIEYGKIQKGLFFLKEKGENFLIERKSNSLLLELKNQYKIKEIELIDLIHNVVDFLKPAPTVSLSRGEIVLPNLSVEERAGWISRLVQRFRNIKLFTLIKKLLLTDQIVSFIAILELSKQGKVTMEQTYSFDDIMIFCQSEEIKK